MKKVALTRYSYFIAVEFREFSRSPGVSLR